MALDPADINQASIPSRGGRSIAWTPRCLFRSAARRLPVDWERAYGYAPVLLETFVERRRFVGTSYKAANWIYVGMTKWRGKLDRENRHALPVKDVYLYPLRRDYRRILTAPSGTGQPDPGGGTGVGVAP